MKEMGFDLKGLGSHDYFMDDLNDEWIPFQPRNDHRLCFHNSKTKPWRT
jgi:hypothetical protein